MDMTKDFLNRVLELDEPHKIEYDGKTFTDKQIYPMLHEAISVALSTSTLTSIVDYIKSDTDANVLNDIDDDRRFVIHVKDYGNVELYKELNLDKRRDNLISASSDNGHFSFGNFMPLENFIICLQSMFVQDENTKALLEFVGSVKNDSSAEQIDDGVSQKITVKQGISLARTAKVPNPVYLCPFRTFPEIEQPQSAFVFRIRKDDNFGATAALFEADGSAWKHEAISSIKQFFTDELKGQSVIILA